MDIEPDDLLDDLFHGCAVRAFVEEAALAQSRPCPERTRRRAYKLYEDALAEQRGLESLRKEV